MTAFPHIIKPRKLNSFRALRAIFRLHKALEESRRREEGAWTNRNHYCTHINIIGTEILGPRLNSFKGGNCSPEAVSRETRNLIERLEAENSELRKLIK
jgi:hypothetical protein